MFLKIEIIKECKFEKNQTLTKSVSFLIDCSSTSSELLNSLFSFLHHWYITYQNIKHSASLHLNISTSEVILIVLNCKSMQVKWKTLHSNVFDEMGYLVNFSVTGCNHGSSVEFQVEYILQWSSGSRYKWRGGNFCWWVISLNM